VPLTVGGRDLDNYLEVGGLGRAGRGGLPRGEPQQAQQPGILRPQPHQLSLNRRRDLNHANKLSRRDDRIDASRSIRPKARRNPGAPSRARTRDSLLRRSFQAGVNLRVPSSEAIRAVRGSPLLTAVSRLIWHESGTMMVYFYRTQ